MTITERHLTPAMCRERLQWLADVWPERGEAVRELILLSTVHPSLAPPCGAACGTCVSCLWHEWRDACKTYAELVNGDLSWEDYEPDLVCADRQGHAIEAAGMWADGVLDVLVNGVRQQTGTGN